MNQLQMEKAQQDYQTVVSVINSRNPTIQFEEFKYQYDRIDFRFWNDKYVYYAEIKGRDILSTKYGDIFISKDKVDYVNERVALENKFSITNNCIGCIFYTFSDGCIYCVSSQFLADNATIAIETMRKSKYGYGDDIKKTEQVYKYNLFADDKKNVLNTGVYQFYNPNTTLKNNQL